METRTLISVAEYLSTSYRPDVDYVDGEIQERNLGEFDHAKIQTRLLMFLAMHEREWEVEVVGECRVQVSAERFRVPDVCVLAANVPHEQIIRHAPLLCIEILSPSDRVSRMRDRVSDYFRMGVREVWLIDTEARTATVYSGDTIVVKTEGDLVLEGTEVRISIADVFSVLR